MASSRDRHPNAKGGVKPEHLGSSAVPGRSYKSQSGSGRAESAGYTTSSPGWRREAQAPKKATTGGDGGSRKHDGGSKKSKKSGGGRKDPRTTGGIAPPNIPEQVLNPNANIRSPSAAGDMLSPGQATSPSSLGGMLYPGQATSPSSLFQPFPPSPGQPPAPQGITGAPTGPLPPEIVPAGSGIPGAQGQPPAPQGVVGQPQGPLPPEIQPHILNALLQRLNASNNPVITPGQDSGSSPLGAGKSPLSGSSPLGSGHPLVPGITFR